jgi:hypothetical protein
MIGQGETEGRRKILLISRPQFGSPVFCGVVWSLFVLDVSWRWSDVTSLVGCATSVLYFLITAKSWHGVRGTRL